MADLSLEFCGVKFPDPFTLAAAPPTDSGEMIKRAFDAGWSSAVCKTMAMEKEEVSLVYPMMHSLPFEGRKVMGLENIDLISERH
ncbi:MAG: NAD-dependent dihydropyrimidine dehydrogenase subunit PreA, partial [Firmicutes bacterium]|nr:NAD-dependent dihydropyrimidine dehydrogenase subunit PreA [Bacillota bacterium]